MNDEGPIANEVMEDIKKHFGFLFDRGYEIHSARTISKSFGAWEVVLKNRHHQVMFSAEKGAADILFGSPVKGFVYVRGLIYFLSGEKEFIDISFFDIFNGMKKDAELLHKHIDEFEACFGNDFKKHEEGLKLANKRYSDRISSTLGEVGSAKGLENNSSVNAIFFFLARLYPFNCPFF